MEKYRKKTMSQKSNTKVLTISLFLLLMVNNCIGGLNDYIDSCMLNYLDNKTIYAVYLEGECDDQEVKSFIEAQEETEACFDYGMDDVCVEQICLDGKETGGQVYIEPYHAGVMKEYMENKEIKELADDEIIVAKYANFNLAGVMDIDRSIEMKNMEPYIGRTMTCVVQNIEEGNILEERKYSFRIAGVFDNIKAGKAAVFYVNDQVRHDMLDVLDYHITARDDEGNVEISHMIYFQAIGRNSQDIRVLKDKIDQKYKDLSILYPVDYPDVLSYILKGTILAGNFIILYITFNSISNIIYVTEDNIYKRRREFGILKAIGYRDRDLKKILLKESLHSSAVSMAASASLGLAVFIVFRVLVLSQLNLYFSSLSFSAKPYTFLLYFVIALGVPLIGFGYGYRKLKHISAVDALRSE